MSEDVAAVMAGGMRRAFDGSTTACLPEAALAALRDAGYAVVKLPEGVAVAHGARLVPLGDEWCGRPVLGIEPEDHRWCDSCKHSPEKHNQAGCLVCDCSNHWLTPPPKPSDAIEATP